MRVLLIEDNKALQKSTRIALEEEGFAVDTASDGREGDFKVRTATYDAIILDLMLPEIDGFTLLKQWRQLGHGIGKHRDDLKRDRQPDRHMRNPLFG